MDDDRYFSWGCTVCRKDRTPIYFFDYFLNCTLNEFWSLLDWLIRLDFYEIYQNYLKIALIFFRQSSYAFQSPSSFIKSKNLKNWNQNQSFERDLKTFCITLYDLGTPCIFLLHKCNYSGMMVIVLETRGEYIVPRQSRSGRRKKKE